MKTILSIFICLLLLSPTAGLAQMATSTGSGVSISSDFVEQVRNLSGEDIEHAPVSLYLGVRKRFSASQAGIAELNITPELVLNAQLLELYVKKTVLTEPIKELVIDEGEVVVEIKGPAKLLGFIPVRLPYEVVVSFDTRLQDITTRPTVWWSFLAQTKSTEEIAVGIQSQLEEARYLSRIQLRALILEAVVEVVGS